MGAFKLTRDAINWSGQKGLIKKLKALWFLFHFRKKKFVDGFIRYMKYLVNNPYTSSEDRDVFKSWIGVFEELRDTVYFDKDKLTTKELMSRIDEYLK